MSETVRTKKRTDSSRNNQSLEAEAVAVGASFDSVGGSIEEHARIVAGRPRARSLPGELVSDIDLAAKWGLPEDEVQESMGRRVTRSTRSTKPERQEVPSRDTSAAMRQEVSDPVSISDASAATQERHELSGNIKATDSSAAMRQEESGPVKAVDTSAATLLARHLCQEPEVLTAEGELRWGQLPAVDKNALRVVLAPRVRRAELEDHLEFFYGSFSDGIEQAETHAVLEPVFSWSNEWTTVHKAGRRVEGGKELYKQYGLTVQRQFFPEWFDSEPDSETDESAVEYTTHSPSLPEIEPIDIEILGSILQDMSDNEDVMELMSDEDIPEEDADLQAVLLASWKDSRASCLGREWRAGSSKITVGAVIVEIDSKGNEIRPEPARSRSPSPSWSKWTKG
ncbi:hypothetical protein B0H13DRAFT_1896437 [Mycena leptocephala]|nr:hypothetical protein B0H13DRAFT_1896437 [Mycena leptocephala]